MPAETEPVPATPLAPPNPKRKLAADCQKIARALGDRQNRDTTLSGGECTKIVNTLLSAGNLLENEARAESPSVPAARPLLDELRRSLETFKLSTAPVEQLAALLGV